MVLDGVTDATASYVYDSFSYLSHTMTPTAVHHLVPRAAVRCEEVVQDLQYSIAKPRTQARYRLYIRYKLQVLPRICMSYILFSRSGIDLPRISTELDEVGIGDLSEM